MVNKQTNYSQRILVKILSLDEDDVMRIYLKYMSMAFIM